MREGQGEELDGVVKEGVEVGQRGEVNRQVRADSVRMVWEGAEFERESLHHVISRGQCFFSGSYCVALLCVYVHP